MAAKDSYSFFFLMMVTLHGLIFSHQNCVADKSFCLCLIRIVVTERQTSSWYTLSILSNANRDCSCWFHEDRIRQSKWQLSLSFLSSQKLGEKTYCRTQVQRKSSDLQADLVSLWPFWRSSCFLRNIGVPPSGMFFQLPTLAHRPSVIWTSKY